MFYRSDFPQRAPLQPEPLQRPLVQQISIIAVERSVDSNVYCSAFVHELPWAALSILIKSKTFMSRQVARRLWNTEAGKVGWRTGNNTTTACKANRYASERSWRGHHQAARNIIVAVDDAVFHLVQFGQYSSSLSNVLPSHPRSGSGDVSIDAAI